MWNRIRDAVWTLFIGRPYSLGQLERRARELVSEMSDTLEMLNAWAARQAKREKREAVKALANPERLTLPSPKAQLYRKAANLRGLGHLSAVTGGSPSPPTTTDGEDEPE